jgi:hypothetical protein
MSVRASVFIIPALGPTSNKFSLRPTPGNQPGTLVRKGAYCVKRFLAPHRLDSSLTVNHPNLSVGLTRFEWYPSIAGGERRGYPSSNLNPNFLRDGLHHDFFVDGSFFSILFHGKVTPCLHRPTTRVVSELPPKHRPRSRPTHSACIIHSGPTMAARRFPNRPRDKWKMEPCHLLASGTAAHASRSATSERIWSQGTSEVVGGGQAKAQPPEEGSHFVVATRACERKPPLVNTKHGSWGNVEVWLLISGRALLMTL